MRNIGLAAVAGAAVLCVISVWNYPTPTDFLLGNPSWNGMSGFARQWHALPLSSPAMLPQDAEATALVIIPYRPVSPTDVSRIGQYTRRGGTVVLLDDYGFGNQILDGLALPGHFAGIPLVDSLANYKSRYLPLVTRTVLLPFGRVLVLNHPTALVGVPPEAVVAWSSPYSRLSGSGAALRRAEDVQGRFPVAAQWRLGRGTLFAVADPSILINGMLGLADNRRFIDKVLRSGGDPVRVFVDQAHLPATRLDQVQSTLHKGREVLGMPVVLLAVLLLSAVVPSLSVLTREVARAERR